MLEFVKKNLKSIIIYASFLIVILVCCVTLITKCVKDNKSNGTTVINSQTFMEMLDHGEDFVIVIGQNECSACQLFNDTLREYTSGGNKVYYLYADNKNDININEALKIISRKLKELPKERKFYSLKTPSTIFIEDGVFKDGYQGYVDTKDSEEYEEFKKIVEGYYVKRKVVLSSQEMLNKINSGDEFVFTLGQHGCGACFSFEVAINKYLQDGNDLYYVYLNDYTDEYLYDFVTTVFNKIELEIPSDREIGQYTPTTIYVKNGVFVEAFQGVIDAYDEAQYEIFTDMMKGEYVGRAYPFA